MKNLSNKGKLAALFTLGLLSMGALAEDQQPPRIMSCYETESHKPLATVVYNLEDHLQDPFTFGNNGTGELLLTNGGTKGTVTYHQLATRAGFFIGFGFASESLQLHLRKNVFGFGPEKDESVPMYGKLVIRGSGLQPDTEIAATCQ